MPKYVKARQGPKNSVIYTDDNGSDWIFEGGFIPWRNQNPGDLRPGTVSRRNGSFGSANGFAVFPDCSSGHAALIDLLQNTYGNKDIPSLMKFYAPPKDRNKTKKYIKFIEKQTGVKGNKKIKNFTSEEFEKLWKAIEQMEGWGRKSGTIRLLDDKKAKILQVHISKNGIIDKYNISGYGWVSKEQGIALTQQGKVDAIVAISPHGHLFLRGRPGHAIS
jgi:hypothetical protein